jgi:hypothetical protein
MEIRFVAAACAALGVLWGVGCSSEDTEPTGSNAGSNNNNNNGNDDAGPGGNGTNDGGNAGGSSNGNADAGNAGDGGTNAAGAAGGEVDWGSALPAAVDDFVVLTIGNSDLAGENVSAVHIDTNNRAWIGSVGFQRFDGESWVGMHRESSGTVLTADGVRAISQAPDGTVWVQGVSELVSLDADTLEAEALPIGYSGAPFAGPWYTDDGTVWTPSQRIENGVVNYIGFNGDEPIADWPEEVSNIFAIEAGRYLWKFDYDSSAFHAVFYRFDSEAGGQLETFAPAGMGAGLDSGNQAVVSDDGTLCFVNGEGIFYGSGADFTDLTFTPDNSDLAASDLRGVATFNANGECVIVGGAFGDFYIARTDGTDLTVTPLATVPDDFQAIPNTIDIDAQGNIWIPGSTAGVLVYVGDY